MELLKALHNGYGSSMAQANGTGEFVFVRVGSLNKPLPAQNTTKELGAVGLEVAPAVLSNMGIDGKTIGLQVELHSVVLLNPCNEFQLLDAEPSVQQFATLMIIEGDAVLELQRDGERHNFTLSSGNGLCYAAFFTDCEYDLRAIKTGLCAVFRLVGECSSIPRGLSPWGFLKAFVVVKEVLAGWFLDLEDDASTRTKKYVFPLDHEYSKLSFSGLQGQDRLVAGLLAANNTLEVRLCKMMITEKWKQEWGGDATTCNYKLSDWVAADGSLVDVKVAQYSFYEEVMYYGNCRIEGFLNETEPVWTVHQKNGHFAYGMRNLQASVIVVWPRNKRMYIVGIHRFMHNLFIKRVPSTPDTVRDIVSFLGKGPEALWASLGKKLPKDYEHHSQTETICKVMELCFETSTRDDCNEMIKVLGHWSNAMLNKKVRAVLASIMQKHGWEPCMTSILELIVVESRVLREARNFAAFAFELSALAVKEARRSLLAAATAKTAALAVAGQTFELVKKKNIFRKLKDFVKLFVAGMVKEFLDAESCLEIERLMEKPTKSIDRWEIMYRSLKEKKELH